MNNLSQEARREVIRQATQSMTKVELLGYLRSQGSMGGMFAVLFAINALTEAQRALLREGE